MPSKSCNAEAESAEPLPATGWVVGGISSAPVAHVLRERLVQPQVIPPAHGDQITEPHMGHLVRDDPRSRRSVRSGGATAVDERVAEGDTAGVFHRSGIEIRHEGLVVLAEGIPAREGPMVIVKALF